MKLHQHGTVEVHKKIKLFLASKQRVPDVNHLCRGMRQTPADRSSNTQNNILTHNVCVAFWSVHD